MNRISPRATDTSPINDEMVRKLCGLTPDGARQLAMLLPLDARARLAMFCNARVHLRERGRAIASECTEQALFLEAGLAGAMLFVQASGRVTDSDHLPDTFARRVS